ncbi:hypothetical protein REPUB_Repub16aG0148000 [Reevesia pubescens]
MEHGNGVMVLDDQDSTLMSNSWSCSQSTPPQVQAYQGLPAGLGLKLSKTPSFLDKLDQLVQGQNSNDGEQGYFNSGYVTSKAKSKDTLQQHANEMKAENFPISLLRIGSWQRVTRNEGDLVAKCYFAKRKLVWEFLENGLKKKIEIQWSDILSLNAVMQEDQPGILDIELNQPPSFHHEIDPKPRKHTQWKMVSDFTGGQASTFRRHHIEFPPGALDRPLEKLLRCDSRLFQLSRQVYPTLQSPYFQKHTFGIDFFDHFGGHVNGEQLFSFANVPTHNLSQNFQTFEQTTQKPLNLRDSGSPISDEHISNQIPLCGQGMNNVRDSLITNQVGGMSFAAAAATSAPYVNSTISLQNNHMPAAAYEGLVPTPSNSQVHPSRLQILNDLQNRLFNDSQTEFSNEIAESNLFREGHPTNNINNMTTIYRQYMVDNIVVMSNNLSSSAGREIYPQPASWPPQSQVPHGNTSMNLLPGNNLFYSSANSDPTVGYFPHFDNETGPGIQDNTWRIL